MAARLEDAQIKVKIDTSDARAELDKLKDAQKGLEKNRGKGKRDEKKKAEKDKKKKGEVKAAANRFGMKIPDLTKVPVELLAGLVASVPLIGPAVAGGIRAGAPLLEFGAPVAAKVGEDLARELLGDGPLADVAVTELRDKLETLSDGISEIKAFQSALQPTVDQLFGFTKGQLLLGESMVKIFSRSDFGPKTRLDAWIS